MSGLKTIFFDLDDTLCAYWQAAAQGLRQAFAEELPPGIDVEQMVEAWATCFRAFCGGVKDSEWYAGYLRSGEPTRTELMRLTLASVGIEDGAWARRLGDAYARYRDGALHLFPEARPVLEALQGRYRLGLMTNGPADIQRQEVATLGLEGLFDPMLIEGEMGFGKPVAAVFDRAEALTSSRPEEILMVGNSYGHDIRPALERGWRAVWIRRPTDVPPSATGVRSRPEERPPDSPAPTFEIGDLRELLTIIEC